MAESITDTADHQPAPKVADAPAPAPEKATRKPRAQRAETTQETRAEPVRARQPRQEAEQVERRRRGVNDITGTLKLGVDTSKLDPKYDYRWINAEEGDRRLQLLTKQDDWDLVRNDETFHEKTTDAGSAVRRPIGALKDGSPHYAYLARKPRQFVEADRREKDAAIEKNMRAIRKGKAVSAEGATLDPDDPNVHIPDSGITIRER